MILVLWMGMFDFLRRRKSAIAPVQPANNSREVPPKVNLPNIWSKLKNVSKSPPEFIPEGSYPGYGEPKGPIFTKWFHRFGRSKEGLTNVPNKKYSRINLASKEARMKEMQKRRASLQYKPKAPFGRR